jgi:flavodoxin
MTRLLVLLATAMFFLISCSKEPGESDAPPTPQSVGKRGVLIVYLSRTENTKAVAEIIQQQVGGDLVQLEPVTPYPDDYREAVAQVDRENETGYLPPLKTRIERMADYDTVFIGFPTWDMQIPPPMKSFLKSYDLRSKTVVPFNTNGGFGTGNSFETVREMCPDSKVLEGFSIEGGRERDGILLAIKDKRRDQVRDQVAKWLERIQMTKP